MVTVEYLEKIEEVGYSELASVEDFVEKHVDRFDSWKYFDDDESETICKLVGFYEEICHDCDVIPFFTHEQIENAVWDMYEKQYEEN